MHFEIYCERVRQIDSSLLEARRWAWRLLSDGGDKIAYGQGYDSAADCRTAIDLVKGVSDRTPVRKTRH